MTVIIAVDSSAVAGLFLGHSAAGKVSVLIGEADDVVVSALCRAEVSVALDTNAPSRLVAEQWADQLGEMWDKFWTVAVDQECLDMAAELASRFQLPLSPAIHLAAFARVEGPVNLVSLDGRQVAPAISLGIEVIELELSGTAHAMLQNGLGP